MLLINMRKTNRAFNRAYCFLVAMVSWWQKVRKPSHRNTKIHRNAHWCNFVFFPSGSLCEVFWWQKNPKT